MEHYSVNIANRLIQAYQPMTLLERRLLYLCISKIDSQESHNGEFVISALEYSKCFSIPLVDSYSDIELGSDKLWDREIILDKDSTRERLRWLSYQKYIKGKGSVSVRFTREVMPYLCLLRSNFTSVKLDLLVKLNSVYSQRLLEQLLQFKKNKKLVVKLEDLIFRLGSPSSYKYGQLKQQILKPAVDELKAKCGMNIVFFESKEGRKVNSLLFTW